MLQALQVRGEPTLGPELLEESSDRHAADSAEVQSIRSSVEQQRLAFRIICRKRAQRCYVGGSHRAGVLDLYCPETRAAVHHEIHFYARTRSPEVQGVVLARVGDPRAQVLGDESLQRCPSDLFRTVQRTSRA